MYFDWITWSIWLVGFLVMVTWIWVPIKEYKSLLNKRKQLELSRTQRNETAEENTEITQINENK